MEYSKLKSRLHSVILAFHDHSFWERSFGGLQPAKEFVCKHLSHCRCPWHSHLRVKCVCPCIQVLFYWWEISTTDKLPVGGAGQEMTYPCPPSSDKSLHLVMSGLRPILICIRKGPLHEKQYLKAIFEVLKSSYSLSFLKSTDSSTYLKP